MTSGVYSITCVVTGKRYVGSAKNIAARWKQHTRALREGTNTAKLQRAWDKYGAENFQFEILEVVPEAKRLLEVEQKYIDQYDTYRNGFNARPVAKSNLGLKLPHTEATKAKISAANKVAHAGRPGPMPKGSRHTTTARIAMSAGKRKNSRKITFAGQSKCLSEWAETIGITLRALDNRLRRKWPLERALVEASRGY